MLRSLFATYREAFSGLSRSAWLLSLATLINRSGTMVMPFLLLFLVEKRGFTTTQAGQTLALYGLAAMVSSYMGGRLCDRFGPMRVIKLSLFLTGVCFLALGRVQGRPAILVMVVLLSLVGEVFRSANLAALTAVSDPGERTRSIALMRLAINLGMTLGPSIGGFLAYYDYGWLFVVDGGTSILAAVLLQIAFPAVRAAAPAPTVRAKAGSPFRDLPTLAILGLMFLLNIVTFQVAGTYPLSLRDLFGFSEAKIGLTLAVNTLIIILFEMVLVHSLSRRDPLKVSGAGALLFCAGLGLLPFGRGFAWVVLTVVVWTLGEMLVFPIVTSAVADRAPEESRGTYMGLLNFSFASAFVVAPLVGTWVYQHLGARTLWAACGAMGVLVGAGFWAVAMATRRAPAPGGGEALPAAET
jgi:MFS family permease